MINNESNSFLCWFCERNLTDHRYVIKDGFAVCLTCYEEKYANHCFQCHEIISIDMQGYVFQNKTWHQSCFYCSTCKKSLIKNKFAYRNDKLFCRSCFITEFAQRCYRCNQPLQPGDKCTEFEKNLYHQSCFVCHECEKPLTNLDFRRRDQYYLCLPCHLNLVAVYCIKCHKAIASEGVLYQNHPFHNECFVCTHCLISLRNQRYVEYDGNAYCSTCFSSRT